VSTASHLPACGPDRVPRSLLALLHPAANKERRALGLSLGNFLAGSRPQLTTAAAALDSTTACTIALARRARAFIVLLAFARFLRLDSCPSVQAFHLYYCTFVLCKQLVRERLS